MTVFKVYINKSQQCGLLFYSAQIAFSYISYLVERAISILTSGNQFSTWIILPVLKNCIVFHIENTINKMFTLFSNEQPPPKVTDNNNKQKYNTPATSQTNKQTNKQVTYFRQSLHTWFLTSSFLSAWWEKAVSSSELFLLFFIFCIA